jgi:hypothetical protein
VFPEESHPSRPPRPAGFLSPCGAQASPRPRGEGEPAIESSIVRLVAAFERNAPSHAPTIGLITFSMPSIVISPWYFWPLMKKVGVALTLKVVIAFSFTALTAS